MAAENGNGNDQPKLKAVLSIDRRLKQRSNTSPFIFGYEDSVIPVHYKVQIDRIFGDNSILPHDLIASHIDQLGHESAKAQELQVAITSAQKFITSKDDDVLYLLYEVPVNRTKGEYNQHLNEQVIQPKPLGLLRYGRRKLYCSDGTELRLLDNCPAILDFFVRSQRCGQGKALFDRLLDEHRLSPSKLAYDRPSPALIAFLKRHYGLVKPRSQHNHYVIFDDIWRQ